jgi:hypothetical protein
MLLSLVPLGVRLPKDNFDDEAEAYLNILLRQIIPINPFEDCISHQLVVGVLKEEFQQVQFKD